MANIRARGLQTSEANRMLDAIESMLSKVFPEIATKYGYNLKFKGGTYMPDGSVLNLRIEAIKDGALSEDAQRYEYNHIRMGLPPLNTPLNYGGKDYIIVGMNTTGSKIKGKKVSNGLVYLLSVEIVKQLWSVQKAGA